MEKSSWATRFVIKDEKKLPMVASSNTFIGNQICLNPVWNYKDPQPKSFSHASWAACATAKMLIPPVGAARISATVTACL